MFIELHDYDRGSYRFLANTDDISVIAELGPEAGKTMIIFSGDIETWRYVTETYDEIKMMLTERLFSRIEEGNK